MDLLQHWAFDFTEAYLVGDVRLPLIDTLYRRRTGRVTAESGLYNKRPAAIGPQPRLRCNSSDTVAKIPTEMPMPIDSRAPPHGRLLILYFIPPKPISNHYRGEATVPLALIALPPWPKTLPTTTKMAAARTALPNPKRILAFCRRTCPANAAR